jgi:hypothetical protein
MCLPPCAAAGSRGCSGGLPPTTPERRAARFRRRRFSADSPRPCSRRYLVEKYFRFLDTVAGRGVFYVFVSALCVASYEEDVGAEGLLGVYTGIGVMAVAAANVVVGVKANEKFKELRGKVGEGSLRDLFEGADEDRSGFLDLSELAAFCRSPGVGIELNHRQWEMLVMEMDADGNGKISFEEFKAWYGRGV